MNLPSIYKVLIVTLSDRAHRGEYSDLSGPKIEECISQYLTAAGWQSDITLTIIPDDAAVLRNLLQDAGEKYNIIITT